MLNISATTSKNISKTLRGKTDKVSEMFFKKTHEVDTDFFQHASVDRDKILKRILEKYIDTAKNTKYENYIDIERTFNDDGTVNKLKVLSYKEKKVLQKLIEGTLYPFYKMWLDIILGMAKKLSAWPLMNKLPKITENLRKIEDIPLFKNRQKEVDAENLYYQVTGLIEDMKEPGFNLNKAVNKIMAKGSGNYNAAHERALNRLATGTVSAVFVGNDFHNVSMYQTDNKEKAEESGKKRFNQEMTRIGASAFLTYSVLSAFSKYTKGMFGAIVALVAAQSSTELISRILAGMPVVPLTPEQAKDYEFKTPFKGSKNNEKEVEKNENVLSPGSIKGPYIQGGVNEFASIVKNQNQTSPSFNGTEPKKLDIVENQNNDTKNNKKENQSLMNILYTILGITGGGILTAILKRKSPLLEKFMKKADSEIKGIKTAIADKNYMVDKTKINEFINLIEKAGFSDLAKTYRELLNDENFLKEVSRVTKTGVIEDKLYKTILKGKYPQAESATNKVSLGRTSTPAKCITAPFEYICAFVKFPYVITDKILNKIAEKGTKKAGKEIKKMSYEEMAKIVNKEMTTPLNFEEKSKALSALRELYEKLGNDVDSKDFVDKLEKALFNSFNSETKQKYSSADLAMYSRVFITLIGTYFFVNDFRNRVLVDSKGKDLKRAKEVTNERIGQKIFNLFTNAFWMSLYNNFFHKAYQASLLGATSIAVVSELTNETVLRKLINVPLGKCKNKEEIEDFEYDTYNAPGPLGMWSRAFAEHTGKKPIGQREA